MTSDAGEGAVPAADFERAHAELLADRSIQFELTPVPGQPNPGPTQIAPPQVQRFERTERRPDNDADGGSLFPPGLGGAVDAGPVALALFWIIVGLIGAGLLYLIVSRVAGWRRPERADRVVTAPEWQVEEASARQMLDEADVLAAAGRYSEAARLLLHRSIGEIAERRPASVRKAFTSRDIAALPSLPPSPAAAFGAIVRAVERSFFGGQPLTAGDWDSCRDAYQRFAFAREWQA